MSNRMTLLDMTQNILSEMDSFNVNSIDDTTESLQVAEIIRTTFYDIINLNDIPYHKEITQPSSSADSSYPTHFVIDEGISQIGKIWYNKAKIEDTKKKYDVVYFMEPEEFLMHTNNRNSDNDNVDVIVDYNGAELLIINDQAPTYWTTFDDEYVVFDSYDNEVDSTIQNSKLQVLVYKEPTFSLTDSFIPDLPSKYFPYLLAESKSRSFYTVKQIPNEKAELEAGRHRRYLSRHKHRTNKKIRYPNYGRK